MFIVQDDQGTHIFTGTRLQMLSEVKDLSLQAIRIETIFMSADEVAEAISAYSKVLNNEEVAAYSGDLYTSGYLYQKTNIVK